eukprot:m.80622 g.80622  ORF g.80622 m.80622 type:complete len:229 (+) comp10917_c0_seq2:1411-2097(+)
MSRLSFAVACGVAVCGLVSAGTNDKGKAYLEANQKKEGVITLPSGLQYKVLRKGSGANHPTKDSPCECHYEGKLIDGTVFDSSYERGSPTTFAPNQVIKGWTEAMQLMVEGDKWEMYIPSELGYGDSGSPPKIQGGDVLVFQMEIIKIKGDTVPAQRCDPATLEGCDDKEKTFIAKITEKFGNAKDKVTKELDRLKGMMAKKMKPEQLSWLSRRVGILSKVLEEKEDL